MTVASKISVVREATGRLYGELATLTPEEWETPGACGVWSVAEVGAHLVWGAELYVEAIRRALAGISEPPPDSGAIPHYETRAAWFAEKSKSYRRELGDGLLAAYQSSGQALVELFESLSPDDWHRLAPHPAGARTVRAILDLRIVELSIHGWEMLHRIGRAASLPAGSHAVLVDWLPFRLRGALARREPLAEPLRYRFELRAPLPRTVRLHLYGDRLEIDSERDQSDSDVALTLDPETYILCFTGRRRWRDALEAGDIVAAGRRDLTANLDRWFPPG
jgi:uncharacterized protein (TIGR03083 family)